MFQVVTNFNMITTQSRKIFDNYTSVNLTKSGVYKHSESDDFEILLFAYSVDGGEVKVVDLAMGEKIPMSALKALADDDVIKWAFNAQFERIWLSKYIGKHMTTKSQRCTPCRYLVRPSLPSRKRISFRVKMGRN